MAGLLLPIAALTMSLAGASAAPADPALEKRVLEIFDESCVACHDENDPTEADAIDLTAPATLLGRNSLDTGRPLIDPGNPGGSYLLAKMTGQNIEGDLMPLGDDPLPPDQLEAVSSWIASMAPAGPAPDPGDPKDPGPQPTPTPGPIAAVEAPKRPPFHGTHQVALPTTTTLGRNVLQYRIDHRFGRIGTERGAFGLDAGVSMAMALGYGILDGWDVQLRRANSRKTWELGTKYVPVRQEEGAGVSFGGYAALSYLRDFDVANPVVGDFILLLSRLWFERWSTMLTAGYHMRTNHNSRVTVDFGDGAGPVLAEDRRDTLTLGFASTVWLGKKKRWGLDLEWIVPIPDGSNPNTFYYRGGDSDPEGTKIGAWSFGGSYKIGKHFFQVFFTNNREIATNLSAAGGETGNPLSAPGIDSGNPFHKLNFFLGFNLGRRFDLDRVGNKERKDKRKKKRAKKKGTSGGAPPPAPLGGSK